MADFDPVREYDNGFVGATYSPEADERFSDYIQRNGGSPYGADVAHSWGFAGHGEGKLTLNFRVVEEVFGKSALPGPAQVRGDCVSHGCKNACLYALSHEIMNREPDEHTGKLEGKPEVSAVGVKAGVLSTEAIYHFRNHRGDGWQCHAAAEVVCNKSGLVVRADYSDQGGPNLERYSGSIAGKYYSGNPPPQAWQKIYKEHQVRTATKLDGREEVRDFLAAANCGVFFCSGLGWSKTRDENGYSRQRGSWSHSQCYAGYDDRPEIKKIYGEALVLIGNSWGSTWIKGPRKIHGTNLEIPNGYYWAKSSLISRTSPIAIASVNGWPIGKMPSYGAKGNI
jgi:hypothetical protein